MNSSTQWYVAQWSGLAWAETGIKLVALGLGAAALVTALTGDGWALPHGTSLAQWVILVILALGLVAAIYDRFLEREITAMIFVIANNLGHWGMVISMPSDSPPDGLLPAFCILMLLGDLVKLRFLRTSGFTVRDVPRRVLYGLTLVYVAGYALILILDVA